MFGDDGDEPTEELSVIDAPLDREGIEEASESLSDIPDECDETDDTFLSLCAMATSGELRV
jgi:hypothetical protein